MTNVQTEQAGDAVRFDEPFVDVDEWREAPARHRYVHGGFRGTDARFSFYLPPAEQYGGRFFQHITPIPDSEHLAQFATGQEDRVSFSMASGAFFVESNGGGPSGIPGADIDPTIAAYRANAAIAQYARVVAQNVYGEHRTYGYAFGGSGGGYRTIGGAENTTGVWDGFVPYVIGSPMAVPNVFAVRMHAQRVLADKLDEIADALEPGGSGDPYATLDDEQREALREVTRMGFPLQAWTTHRGMGTQSFGVLYPAVLQADPGYFRDFWTVPGYLGADSPAEASVHRQRRRFEAAVLAVTTRRDQSAADGAPGNEHRGGVDQAFKGPEADPNAVVSMTLDIGAEQESDNAELVVLSGAAEGTHVSLSQVHGATAVVDFPDVNPGLAGLRPGDVVRVDNSNFLAAQTYHRHQVPTPDFVGWDQFRDDEGRPRYPQRPLLLGPLFAQAAAGTVQTGQFEGKMIVVASLLDREAFPWQADWYRSKVREHRGNEREYFRLWFTENALHADEEAQADPAHTVSYLGVLQAALRQVSAWVERGVTPADSTGYTVEDAQVLPAATARDRGGVQPVVTLTVDGGAGAQVAVGSEVRLELSVESPSNAGEVILVEWDLDGDGLFETSEAIEPKGSVVLNRVLTVEVEGTRFLTVRVTSQGDGDATSPWARLQNLARVRIIGSLG